MSGKQGYGPRGWGRWMILALLWIPPWQAGAQYILEGIVLDSLSQPIPGAQLQIVSHDTASIPAYIFTGQEGKFRGNWEGADSVRIGVRALGFKPKDTVMRFGREGEQKPLLFVLREGPLQLREVVVEADRPIVQKRDTVEIRVAPYLQGSEQTAEEVLSRLPGVEVTDDGEIRVRGRPVRKVLIEGDDLFNSGYRLLTRNLSADIIERVQILKRHQDNPLLHGIRPSDAIALNITLKPEVKGSLSGRVGVGLGTPGLYDVQANTIYIRKMAKVYGLASGNSIGKDPTGDIFSLIHPELSGEDPYPGDAEAAPSLLQLGLPVLPVREEYLSKNDSGMGMSHMVLHLTGNLKLTAQLLGTFDRRDLYWRARENFLFEDRFFENREISNLQFGRQMLSCRAGIIFDLSPKHRLEWDTRFSDARLGSEEELTLNGDTNQQFRQKQVSRLDSRLAYTFRLDSASALQLKLRLIEEQEPAVLKFDGFNFAGLFAIPPSGLHSDQDSRSALAFYGFSLGFFRKKAAVGLGLSAEYFRRRAELTSRLEFSGGAPTVLLFGRRSSSVYDSFGLLWDFRRQMRKMSFWMKLRTSYVYTALWEKEQDRNEMFILIPKIGMQWRPGSGHNLLVSYAYDFNDNRLADRWSGRFLSGYRNLRNGLGYYFPYRSHRFMARYAMGSWGEPSLFQVTLLLRQQPKYPGDASRIDQGYAFTMAEIYKDRILATLSASMDQFLPWGSANLKLKGSVTHQAYENRVNGLLQYIVSNSFTWGAELRSVFSGPFNFHSGLQLSHTLLHGSSSNRAQWFNGFLDLEYRPGAELLGILKNELYTYPEAAGGATLFSDLQLSYTPAGSRSQWFLNVQNIWGIKQLGTFSANDTSLFTSYYQVRPRSILLKLMLRL